ncbi:hypothetical protein [Streptomyces rochei]|uniref:hypothetical protein n=1 Tax=Streptomyces rochei TaxID=1928 RepID=UPI0036277CA2
MGDERFRSNLDMLILEADLTARPDCTSGLSIAVGDPMERVFLCAGPYFALERWCAGTAEPMRHSEVLGRAEMFPLPAAWDEVEVAGPADVLLGYLPDLDRDVRGPLLAAGYPPPLLRRFLAS